MVGSNLALAQAFNAVAADAAPKRTIDRLSGLKFACHLPRGSLPDPTVGQLVEETGLIATVYGGQDNRGPSA